MIERECRSWLAAILLSWWVRYENFRRDFSWLDVTDNDTLPFPYFSQENPKLFHRASVFKSFFLFSSLLLEQLPDFKCISRTHACAICSTVSIHTCCRAFFHSRTHMIFLEHIQQHDLLVEISHAVRCDASLEYRLSWGSLHAPRTTSQLKQLYCDCSFSWSRARTYAITHPADLDLWGSDCWWGWLRRIRMQLLHYPLRLTSGVSSLLLHDYY